MINHIIRDQCRGLVIANDTVSPDCKVDVFFAELVLQDAQYKPLWIRETKLTIDITQRGPNGLDAGTEAGYTWYYIWAIANYAGTRAGLLSRSRVDPLLPSGFTHRAFLGVVHNCRNGGSDFGPVDQRDHTVARNAVAVLNSGTATVATAVDCAPALPEGAKVAMGDFTLNIGGGGGRGEAWIRSRIDQGAVGFAGFLNAQGYVTTPFCVPVCEAQRLYYNRLASSAAASVTISISGFQF
jgi:hypothetical protein